LYRIASPDDQLRLLKISVERSSDEIFWLDFEGNIQYVNDAACQNTGYSQKELCTMNIAGLDTEMPPGAWEACVADLRERKTQFITSRHQCKNGTFIDVDILAVYVNHGDHEFSFAFVRDITERKRAEKALAVAKKKLNLLNYVTFNDIQSLIFSLSGYQQLVKSSINEKDSRALSLVGKQEELLQKIADTMKFSQTYQDLGMKSAQWQNVRHAFIMAISHMDFSKIKHTLPTGDLEIYADPLFEQVFEILADNTRVHSGKATRVNIGYEQEPDGSLLLYYEDNGAGIPKEIKNRIFLPEFQKKKGIGLFLAREILEITEISIKETGTPGKGVRFEMTIPKGAYRFLSASS
jgi:PAS domain S-box-containing protein